ncbi:MAG: 16S rRNA (cytosine(1402)-N(4))-methyltransferase RsmH [Geobacteraceae bacterium]|nr:16S rRNA (cytosine(1402)-N(4))-methyltransferase RsmH [Geobacteraceae bacterium]
MGTFHHISVLPAEVAACLQARAGGIYVDGTIGGAGHARDILEASSPDGFLIGLDRDPEALEAAEEALAAYEGRVKLFHGNFTRLPEILHSVGVDEVDGMLLDLGVSSHQLDKGERGFSFQQDAPLDMRMDTSSSMSAADLVNSLPESELANIIWRFGEERWSRRIAAAMVTARKTSPILTTRQLAELVAGAIPRARWEARIHPATRTFQAIRIAVNDELAALELVLPAAVAVLRSGGRLVVISFHSLEDRIVKTVFNDLSRGCICPKSAPLCVCGRTPVVRKVTGKPLTAGPEEIAKNPRSRSAKLRAIQKI